VQRDCHIHFQTDSHTHRSVRLANLAHTHTCYFCSSPQYFKKIRISAVALIKLVMHARSGGNIEVMGLLQGKIEGDTYIVLDAFGLPVEGTETRVNAGNTANEYMIGYMDQCEKVGRLENVCGWYHSHPGYGCWLSGIDVGTQSLHQKHEDPYVAIVVDPTRTISAGKVEIGAFRTYPEGYTPPNTGGNDYETVPLDKIEDFGVHHSRYYPLEMSFFKSSLDAQLLDKLWNKYWIKTLSSSPLTSNLNYTTDFLHDMAAKMEKAESAMVYQGKQAHGSVMGDKEESQIKKIARDATKLSVEQSYGLMLQITKSMLFNKGSQCIKPQ